MNKLVILDRDGVINQDLGRPVLTPEEWEPLPGSLEAIRILTEAGYQIGVASNQPVYGDMPKTQFWDIHKKMLVSVEEAGGQLAIGQYCIHQKNQRCSCRKPEVDLLNWILKWARREASLDIWFIGDQVTDIQAARAAGVRPVLVLTGKGMETFDEHPNEVKDCLIFRDLLAAIKTLTESLDA